MIVNGLLVALVVVFCSFTDEWFAFPMTSRPMVVGALVGLVLGDLTTGVVCGATLELVFMGVAQIGGTTPPDSLSGTAVGVAFAILLRQGTDIAVAMAVPASMLCQMLHAPLIIARGFINPAVERAIERDDDKAFSRYMVIDQMIYSVPKGLVCFLAVAAGSELVQGIIDVIPLFVTDGLAVANRMIAAVGIALLLKLMWSKTRAVYYFAGFILVSYFNVPLLAVAMIGVVLSVILYLEEREAGARQPVTEKEELFDD